MVLKSIRSRRSHDYPFGDEVVLRTGNNISRLTTLQDEQILTSDVSTPIVGSRGHSDILFLQVGKTVNCLKSNKFLLIRQR